MKQPIFRLEDVLREMRGAVVPVDDPEAARARRLETVSRLRDVQAERRARIRIERSWQRRALVAALIFLPSGALAATWIAWKGHLATHTVVIASTRSIEAPRGVTGAPEGRRADSAAAVEAPSGRLAEEAPAGLIEHDATSAKALRAAPWFEPKAATSGLAVGQAAFDSKETSTLGAENALIETAMSATRHGDDVRALALFDQFLARYPRSELAQNAEVERFRAAKRLGDVKVASREARRYLGDHPDGMARDEARRLAVEPSGNDRPPR